MYAFICILLLFVYYIGRKMMSDGEDSSFTIKLNVVQWSFTEISS